MLLQLRRAALRRPLSLSRLSSSVAASQAIAADTRSVGDEKWIRLMQQTSRLESSVLLPLNEKLLGPLDRKHSEEKLPSLPFVFLLGNHSSGKSSFINYLLQRDVQSTGVAPTDDGFTIIAPGHEDLDQDGPALVGDPDLGFSGLRTYGPALIQRTQLKVRKGIQANFMLVDSPGMIDSPHSPSHQLQQVNYGSIPSERLSSQQQQQQSKWSLKGRDADRGYEFPEVVRWYAERADVVLLFFDPDKPGTTGETLSILTRSLIGMDHKLHLVLNKVDQFRKIHDFARAYGSLCWNLSKVIPLKDLPRIYTMCIPTKDNQMQAAEGLGTSMKDLDAMRDEVVSEVRRAPERRVDNLITNLYDSSRLLKMHAEVFEDLRVRYARERRRRLALVFATFVGGNALAASVLAGGAIEAATGLSVTSAFASAGVVWHNSTVMTRLERDLLHEDLLGELFRRRYGRQLAEGDEYVMSLWKRVLPSLQVAVHTLGFRMLPKLKNSEIAALDNIVSNEIPALRRQCAPTNSSLVHQVAKMFRN